MLLMKTVKTSVYFVTKFVYKYLRIRYPLLRKKIRRTVRSSCSVTSRMVKWLSPSSEMIDDTSKQLTKFCVALVLMYCSVRCTDPPRPIYTGLPMPASPEVAFTGRKFVHKFYADCDREKQMYLPRNSSNEQTLVGLSERVCLRTVCREDIQLTSIIWWWVSPPNTWRARVQFTAEE